GGGGGRGGALWRGGGPGGGRGARPAAMARAAPRSSHRGALRSLGLGGADEPVAVPVIPGVDRHSNRKAGEQHAAERASSGKRDPHGNTLHDLGEIPGRIVRRQQTELGAAGWREAFD